MFCTFRVGEPARIETNVSDLTIRVCFCQQHDGKWKPVVYYSRKMTAAKQNYDIHDKKLLTIISALQQWKVYAKSCSELTIFTDHKNLLKFTITKKFNRRQVRWSELLGQYKFKIIYTPNKNNGKTDAFSRRSNHIKYKNSTKTPVFKQKNNGFFTINQLAATLKVFIPNVKKTFTKAYATNKLIFDLKKQQQTTILTYQRKTYVPKSCTENIIRDHHDDPVQKFPKISKTMEFISRDFVFPKMRFQMETYIKNCVLCQQNKSAKHARYGQIKFAPVPTLQWHDVTMDFVVKLPKSKNPTTQEIYDSIMVMVDKLTKYALMILFKKSYKADQLGFILLDKLIKDHGIPASITLNKNKFFTSNYWKTLISAIGTKLRMSTIYHPETDKQTEKINQSMETYFKHYVNCKQNNWVSFLPITQLAHNNKKSDTTGLTPFFANYGKHPELFHAPKPGPNAHKAMVTASDMTKLHKKMADAIIQNNNKIETRINSKKKNGISIKRGG